MKHPVPGKWVQVEDLKPGMVIVACCLREEIKEKYNQGMEGGWSSWLRESREEKGLKVTEGWIREEMINSKRWFRVMHQNPPEWGEHSL